MTIFTAEQLLNPEKKEKPDDTFDVEIQFSEKKALNSVSTVTVFCFQPTLLLLSQFKIDLLFVGSELGSFSFHLSRPYSAHPAI